MRGVLEVRKKHLVREALVDRRAPNQGGPHKKGGSLIRQQEKKERSLSIRGTESLGGAEEGCAKVSVIVVDFSVH